MIELISWIVMTVHWIAIPSMAIIGILYHKQRKTKGSLIFATGFIIIFIGMIIGFIFPQTLELETIEEAKQIVETVGPPLHWFFDDIVNAVGIIITVLGFGLIVIEDKRYRNPS